MESSYQIKGPADGKDGDNGLCRTLILKDSEILECVVCGMLLSTPVNECEEGHLACSSCCKEPGKKCPFQYCYLGYSRCRAIEKVLRSLALRCRNAVEGCEVVEAYDCRDKLSSHEKSCAFHPSPCPFPDCNHLCSSRKLFLHFLNAHKGHKKIFQLDEGMPIYLDSSSEAYLLEEQNERSIFFLMSKSEGLGYAISLDVMKSPNREKYLCDIVASDGEGCLLKIESAEISPSSYRRLVPLLFIPEGFFRCNWDRRLNIRIWLATPEQSRRHFMRHT